MGALQPIHLIIILLIVVLLFGGSKIPELMKGVGKGMGEFKKGLDEGKQSETVSSSDESQRIKDKQAELDAQKKKIAEQEEELRRLQSKTSGS